MEEDTKELIKIIQNLSPDGLNNDEEQQLGSSLEGTTHAITLYVVRNSWTLTYDVPEDYQRGRCICGHLGDKTGPEVEVMFHNSRKKEIEGFRHGDLVNVNVRYCKFDNLYRRVCFIDSEEELGNPISKGTKAAPETATAQLSQEPKPLHYYLANILIVAYADGNLCPEEDAVLNKILENLGAATCDLDLAFKIVESGDYQGKTVGTFSEQVRNLEDMMRICMADGEIHENENQWISYFAGLIGLEQSHLDRLYEHLDSTIRS